MQIQLTMLQVVEALRNNNTPKWLKQQILNQLDNVLQEMDERYNDIDRRLSIAVKASENEVTELKSQIDKKSDMLVKHFKICQLSYIKRWRQMRDHGEKLEAVKEYKNLTGSGLLDAKRYIESL